MFFKTSTQVLLNAQNTRPKGKEVNTVKTVDQKNSQNFGGIFYACKRQGEKGSRKNITSVFLAIIAFFNEIKLCSLECFVCPDKHLMPSQPSFMLCVLAVSHLHPCKVLWAVTSMKGAIKNTILFSHILVNFQNTALGCTHAALAVAIGSFLPKFAGITWTFMLLNFSDTGGEEDGSWVFSPSSNLLKIPASYCIHLKVLNVHIRSSPVGHLPWKKNFPGQKGIKIFYYRNILFRP